MDPAATADPAVPSRLALARWPAVITLCVTAARLALELAHAPEWLAGRQPGSPFAVLGISYLPFIFGPWFALKIARAIPTRGRQLARLYTTLLVYGYLARIPVLALYFLDVAFGWGTHYGAFPPPKPGEAELSETTKALLVCVAQLGFWPIVWTGLGGSLAGLVALLIAKPKPAASGAAITP